MKDLTRRLRAAPLEAATEMIRRSCFPRAELEQLYRSLLHDEEKAALRSVIAMWLHGRRPEPQPAWLAALANGDRQLAIHAVINAGMSDSELQRFDRLVKLQPDGHLVRQLRAAIELEQKRREIGGKRGSRNRITRR
ncbi:MAG TPA: hypothetical protein VFC10_07285 [Terriglobia bacterium]|jgi:hypothetical protein|nr:hypothetical protein [Terracidiphilus sp.]HZT69536.1 hypothetical protein [Terriglobia bacterium]